MDRRYDCSLLLGERLVWKEGLLQNGQLRSTTQTRSSDKTHYALRIKFNSHVRHGELYSWDALIRLKAQELANYVIGKRTNLDFGEPTPELNRIDSVAVRKTILSLKTSDARKLGLAIFLVSAASDLRGVQLWERGKRTH